MIFLAIFSNILVVFLPNFFNLKTRLSRPVGQNCRAKMAFLSGVLAFFGRQTTAFFEALKRKILVVFMQISANFKTGRSRPVGQNWRAKTAFY